MFRWTIRQPVDGLVVAVLGPLLMGFDPNVAILMAGVATLIFFVVTGGHVPSFLGSRNLVVAAITLVLGTGDFTLRFHEFAMGGIGTATFGAILLHALLARGKP